MEKQFKWFSFVKGLDPSSADVRRQRESLRRLLF